jgi:beta-glucuronidase
MLLFSIGNCGYFPTPAPKPMSITPSASASPVFHRPLHAVPPFEQSLSDEWRFAIDPTATGQVAGWFEPSFDDALWTAVTVPHTWNVMPEHAHYAGLAWYRRQFVAPAVAQDASLRLRFEAVFYLAHVWLNGVYLGAHEGGYTPFEFDVSDIIKPGAGNLIAVQVDNRRATTRLPATLQPRWSFDWWNYGGIVRDVWWLLTSRAFISRQRIVAVPHLIAAHEADYATVTSTVNLRNTATDRVEGHLTGDVLDDATGLSVLSSQPSLSVTVPPGESLDVELVTTIPAPTLWHFDHPHLYRWSASLRTGDGELLHTDEVRFGVRSVQLKQAQIHLNGEPVRLVGITRHADSPAHGLAETITVMAADYADLKALNTVLSRPAHYPQAEFIMDYADRAGIMLIPEVPAWQLTAGQMDDPRMRQLQRRQLHEMITAQWNHPSVWAWSLGNEFESKTPSGHAFVRDMIAHVKALDPTRPVGFASNRLNRQPKGDATALADFVMMNQYFGTWGGSKDRLGPALEAIHATWPDKPVIISEYGFEPRWEKLVKWPLLRPSQFYRIGEDVPADSDAADRERRRVISEQIPVMRAKPFVAGAIFWTYQDYRTPTDYHMGVVDAHRRRRGSWALLREEYSPLLIESVTIAPWSPQQRNATIALRARGPVDRDMPVYTLRGYRLAWVIASAKTSDILSQGDQPIPTLAPGATWPTRVEWPSPTTDALCTLKIIRPTGFTVLESTYDALGNQR